MKKALLALCTIAIFSCNAVDDMKENMASAIIKKTTGLDMETSNTQNMDKNKVSLNMTDDGLNLKEQFNEGRGNVTMTKDGVVITITDKNQENKHLIIGFTGKDINTTKPIKGQMNKTGDNSMSLSTANYAENQASMMISMEVAGEILSLSPTKTTVKFKGQLANVETSQDPTQWKTVEGTIDLHYPIFSALGTSKEAFIY